MQALRRRATRERLHADAERVWGPGWQDRSPMPVEGVPVVSGANAAAVEAVEGVLV